MHTHGLKHHARGQTHRRERMPVEGLETLPGHGHGAPKALPESGSRCPTGGTLTVPWSRALRAPVWGDLAQ
jgi:hypothetical protein